eukprot:4063485-Amphidinium_carterae.1
MSKVRQERAGQWRESLSQVADPRSVKAFRFIKQGDCAQFHFVQREDGSATSVPLEQDAIIRKHWDDIHMPPELPNDAFVRAHVLPYVADVEPVPFAFTPLT